MLNTILDGEPGEPSGEPSQPVDFGKIDAEVKVKTTPEQFQRLTTAAARVPQLEAENLLMTAKLEDARMRLESLGTQIAGDVLAIVRDTESKNISVVIERFNEQTNDWQFVSAGGIFFNPTTESVDDLKQRIASRFGGGKYRLRFRAKTPGIKDVVGVIIDIADVVSKEPARQPESDDKITQLANAITESNKQFTSVLMAVLKAQGDQILELQRSLASNKPVDNSSSLITALAPILTKFVEPRPMPPTTPQPSPLDVITQLRPILELLTQRQTSPADTISLLRGVIEVAREFGGEREVEGSESAEPKSVLDKVIDAVVPHIGSALGGLVTKGITQSPQSPQLESKQSSATPTDNKQLEGLKLVINVIKTQPVESAAAWFKANIPAEVLAQIKAIGVNEFVTQMSQIDNAIVAEKPKIEQIMRLL